MADNVRKMQESVASEEELLKVSDEFFEFALKFKKQSSQLRLARMRKKVAIASGVVLGGALIGFCIGGPGSVAVLVTEAAEVAGWWDWYNCYFTQNKVSIFDYIILIID